jgi:rhodanese-related sulfurtransferase
MKRVPVFVVIFLMLASVAYCEAPASRDVQKSTSFGECATAQEVYEGNHVTAVEACEVWKANPQAVNILDVRTPEEYVYVGHAPAAINIPWSLWTGKWDQEKKDFALSENPHFVGQVKERFKTGDMILVMCRSGERSTEAVDRLRREGFWNAYSVVDGFEGAKSDDEQSYSRGKRMNNGWKNAGGPWTYDIEITTMAMATK